jgi:hypothetical protein
MNILIYFSLFLSLNITSITCASRSSFVEIEEVQKKSTSLETLRAVMLRRVNLERGLQTYIANDHVTVPNLMADRGLANKYPMVCLTGAPDVGGKTPITSMRRPRANDLPITDEAAPKAAQERISYMFAGVLLIPERLRMIGSLLSYESEEFKDFSTLPTVREDFRIFSLFSDIGRFCLVSKLWNKSFNNKEFLIGYFPELEHVKPEDYGAKTPLGALILFNAKRFDDLTEQRRVVENAARARVLENVLRIPELVRLIGFSLSYEEKAFEEFWVLSDIKNFCLVSKLWNRTLSAEKFLIDRFPHLEQVRKEGYGEKSLLGIACLLAKSGFTKVWTQDSDLWRE